MGVKNFKIRLTNKETGESILSQKTFDSFVIADYVAKHDFAGADAEVVAIDTGRIEYYKIQTSYAGISQYHVTFYHEDGKWFDHWVCWDAADLIGLIRRADAEGYQRAEDWLEPIKDIGWLREYIEQHIGQEA